MSFRKAFKKGALFGTGALAVAYVGISSPPLESVPPSLLNARLFADCATRAARCAKLGLFAAWEYSVRRPYMTEFPESQTEWNVCHRRVAHEIYEVAQLNSGLYVKTAQVIASFSDVLPPIYTTQMRLLQDKIHPRPFTEILKLLQEEFGEEDPISSRFESFEREPLACASIAQVHVAVPKGSTARVAVKCQRLEISHNYSQDLWLILQGFKIAGYISGPSFDWSPIIHACTDVMHNEIDFRVERSNLERMGRELHTLYPNEDVVTPTVVPALSTRRVLTTEYVEGSVHAKDREGILRVGASPRQAAELLCDVFARQLFSPGLLAQADCHGANILVRRHPKRPAATQVVLLDHGLDYEIANPRERQLLADVWTAACTRDDALLKDVLRELRIRDCVGGTKHEMLATVFLQSIYSTFALTKTTITEAELQQLRDGAQDERVTALISELPQSWLLALSTISQYRAVHKLLSENEHPPVPRTSRMLRISLQYGRRHGGWWATQLALARLWWNDLLNHYAMRLAFWWDPELKKAIPDELLQVV